MLKGLDQQSVPHFLRNFYCFTQSRLQSQLYSLWGIYLKLPLLSTVSISRACQNEFVGVVEGQVAGASFRPGAGDTSAADSMSALLQFASTFADLDTAHGAALTPPPLSVAGEQQIPEMVVPLVEATVPTSLLCIPSAAFTTSLRCQQSLRAFVCVVFRLLGWLLAALRHACQVCLESVRRLTRLCSWLPPLSALLSTLEQGYSALWLMMGRFPTVWHLVLGTECVVPAAAQPQQQPNFVLFGLLKLLRCIGDAVIAQPIPESQTQQPVPGRLGRGAGSCTCALCQHACEQPFETPCRHSFCWPCITQWLASHPVCPICRRHCTSQLLSPSLQTG